MSKDKKSKIKTSKKLRRQKIIVLVLLAVILMMSAYQINTYYQNKKAEDATVYSALMLKQPMCQSLDIILLSKEKGSDENLFENNNNKIEYSDIKNYDEDNLERYIAYHELYPDLMDAEVIWRVNTKLDYPFYENTTLVDNPDSYTVVVNKYYYLDSEYVPSDLVKIAGSEEIYLRKAAYDAFLEMQEAIKKAELNIGITSAYRDYYTQNTLYNEYVAEYTQEEADTFSARAGFSEHQTGLAIDINDTKTAYTDFNKTEAYDWIADNAHRFGFIIRYQADSELTGYEKEPWHLRYVTKDIAIDMYENNINILEEYLDKYGH